MTLVLLANVFLDPITGALASVLAFFTSITHTPALSLLLLALALRLLFFPLNNAQFKSAIAMQKLAPRMKKLQERYKNDQQKLQAETMALYKETGVNPLAGCWPMLVQLPVIICVYYAVTQHIDLYRGAHFLWVGSSLADIAPKVFNTPLIGASLAAPDVILMVLYMVSQYVSMRYTTMPATDPAQAQQLKLMQVVSPLMIGFFGFKAQWPSAMVFYWLCYNVFAMAQQFYLLKRYHQPLSAIDSEHVVTDDVPAGSTAALNASPAPTSKKAKKQQTKGA